MTAKLWKLSQRASFNGQTAVDDTFRLLSIDLLTGTRWLDVRKSQDASREFGPGPTAAWEAFRKIIPMKPDPAAPPPAQIGRASCRERV